MSKRVAVTGASGFVGRYVLQALTRSGIRPVATCRSAKHSTKEVEWVTLDYHAPPKDVFDLLGRPEVVVHLAWQGLPNYKDLFHFESELPKQYAFLRALVDQGLRQLVVTGTCFEYGMLSGPLSEECTPHPDNPYGHAKNTLRQQLEFLRAKHSFELTWARLFYMHGNGQAQNSLLPQLERAIAEGKSHFDMSGGEQLRDYLPVEQVAGYLVQLALLDRGAGTVNVSSGQPISVRKLVEQWIGERGASIELNLGYYPYPSYEPLAFWGTREKLDEALMYHDAKP